MSEYSNIFYFFITYALLTKQRFTMNKIIKNRSDIMIVLASLLFIINLSTSQACSSQIMQLYWTDCKVSYSNCDNNIGFTFLGCTQRYCADYSYNRTSNRTQCVRYDNRVFNQLDCTAACCTKHPFVNFTFDSLTTCKLDDDQKIKEAGIIAGSIIGAIVLFVLVGVAVYCIRKHGCDCGRCAECCQGLCDCLGACGAKCKNCCFYNNDAPLEISKPQDNTTHVIIYHNEIPTYPTVPVIPPIDANFIKSNTNMHGTQEVIKQKI